MTRWPIGVLLTGTLIRPVVIGAGWWVSFVGLRDWLASEVFVHRWVVFSLVVFWGRCVTVDFFCYRGSGHREVVIICCYLPLYVARFLCRLGGSPWDCHCLP